MKRLLFFSILVICGIVAYASDSYTKREAMIEMRDGNRLYTAIYEPAGSLGPRPIIMMRTPYGSGPYGAENAPNFSEHYLKEFARNGYIIVIQDVRGKNMSEGEFENIRPFVEGKKTPRYNKRGEVESRPGTPIDEASDTYDTAEWLIKNTNSNGNIGVMGVSYLGFYSTMAALSGHPAIKAVSPQAPVTDWFRGDDVHHNGAFCAADLFSFLHWFEHLNTPAWHDGDHSAAWGPKPTDAIKGDIYNANLAIGPIRNYTKLNGDSIRTWLDVVAHPDFDEWWEARSVLNHVRDVKPAIMVVGGLFDAEDGYGAWATYKAIRDKSPQTELYLVEGPWAHGAWKDGADEFFGNVYFGPQQTSEHFLTEIEYPFFAWYLEGKGEKPVSGARVFDSGSRQWLHFPDGWSAQNQMVEFQLTPGATYTSDPNRPVPYSPEFTGWRTNTYMLDDQRFAAARPDVAVFTGEVLTDTLQVLGEIEVDLDVAITTTDADFIVKLIDVFPNGYEYPDGVWLRKGAYMDGYQMLVRADVMRGKYRNSLSEPEPFVPGETTKVRFTLPDVAHSFLPGHRIMVQVQSTWYPIIDRNPQTFCNIYECDESSFQPTTVTILPTSRLLLPVSKGDDNSKLNFRQ